MIGMRPCPSGAFYGQEANTADTCGKSQDIHAGFTEEMLGSIKQQIKTNWKTFEDESRDVFEINCEIFDKAVTAFFVTGWMNECVEYASNLSKIHRGSLDQGEDESGEKVDSTVVPMEVGFQGVLEFCMLVRRASDLS
jgi:hypothetical protein